MIEFTSTPLADTQQRVRDCMVNTLGLDESELTPDAKLREDLDIDSLSAVELAMALEMEFEIDDIPVDGLEDAKTVEDLGNYIAGLTSETATLQT